MRESRPEEIELICPCCRRTGAERPERSRLELDRVFKRQADYVIEGFLVCGAQSCRREFPIVAGVPIIIDDLAAWFRTEGVFVIAGGNIGPEIKAFFHSMPREDSPPHSRALQLGAYLGSHYHTAHDPAAETGNDRFWRQLVEMAVSARSDRYARALDLGCSVGRLTFELADHADLSIGLDTDFSAVAIAAGYQRERAIRFPRTERALSAREYASPVVPRENVLFLVADVLDPPFSAETFDLVSAVNLLDNVPVPLILIGQIDALLRRGGVFLHCSPYAWRANIAEPVEWLETEEIAAPEMVRRLLTEQYLPRMKLSYDIRSECDNVPWILDYGQRQKSVFAAHMLSARKSAGSND